MSLFHRHDPVAGDCGASLATGLAGAGTDGRPAGSGTPAAPVSLPADLPADLRSDLSADFPVGAIVSFRFPRAEGGSARRAKPRTCLVIGHRPGRMVLAYGTSADTRANQGLEILVTDPADLLGAGLHKPTRFVLARRVCVKRKDSRLISDRFGSAVIGHLPAHLRTQIGPLIKGLGAELFTACHASRVPKLRECSWTPKPPPPSSPPSFTVEYRRRRVFG